MWLTWYHQEAKAPEKQWLRREWVCQCSCSGSCANATVVASGNISKKLVWSARGTSEHKKCKAAPSSIGQHSGGAPCYDKNYLQWGGGPFECVDFSNISGFCIANPHLSHITTLDFKLLLLSWPLSIQNGHYYSLEWTMLFSRNNKSICNASQIVWINVYFTIHIYSMKNILIIKVIFLNIKDLPCDCWHEKVENHYNIKKVGSRKYNIR